MEYDYVKEMVLSKGKSSVTLAKYIGDHDSYPDKIFCFFEGEDYKYYRTRIIQYLGIEEDEIFHYNCNGKKEVLKVCDDLKNDKTTKKIFFIDKDFDEDIIVENVFQTDGYSVENYYVTDVAFKNFLLAECDFNVVDKNLKRCLADYKKMREEFNIIISQLNAYICYMRLRDKNETKRIKLPDEKDILNKFIKKIEINKIISKDIKNIEDIKIILNDDREIDENEILRLLEEFRSLDNKELVYRGKFEVYFLKKFIEDLMKRIRKKDYFEDFNKSVKFDMSANILTYFSSYAETSNKLKTFLSDLKRKYFK